jgi:hypothetical protein
MDIAVNLYMGRSAMGIYGTTETYIVQSRDRLMVGELTAKKLGWAALLEDKCT